MGRIIVVLVFLVGFSQSGPATSDAEPASAGAPSESKASPPAFLRAARAVVPAPLGGSVLEVLQAGGYTYLRVDAGAEGARWVVVLAQQASVGDEVVIRPYGQLSHFASKRTGRTFDSLLFATLHNRSI